jgi:hypothetical protein
MWYVPDNRASDDAHTVIFANASKTRFPVTIATARPASAHSRMRLSASFFTTRSLESAEGLRPTRQRMSGDPLHDNLKSRLDGALPRDNDPDQRVRLLLSDRSRCHRISLVPYR